MKRPRPEQLPPMTMTVKDVDDMIEDILDSVRLAMCEAGLRHHVDDVIATVESYITNHYGE